MTAESAASGNTQESYDSNLSYSRALCCSITPPWYSMHMYAADFESTRTNTSHRNPKHKLCHQSNFVHLQSLLALLCMCMCPGLTNLGHRHKCPCWNHPSHSSLSSTDTHAHAHAHTHTQTNRLPTPIHHPKSGA